MRQVRASRTAFAILMIVTGSWGLVVRDFVAIWAPGIQPPGVRPAMAIACALVSAVAGTGLLLSRHRRTSARLLLGFLILWIAWCKLPPLFHAPLVIASWESVGETLVVTAAAWALAAGPDDGPNPGGGKVGGAPVLYGLALIAFGAAHFAYPALTAALVPRWVPWPLEWVYFTGAAYVAAGAALASRRFSMAAASLSSLQMALFGLLVWLPKILQGALDPDTLNETAISFALAVSGWVVASFVASASGRTSNGPKRLFSHLVLIGKSRALR